ncbi:Uncharacterised protein [Shigella sonnei]|nr:Uncharacterised protein [Shigella sonnei]
MSLSVLSKRNVPVVPGFRRISGGAASNGAGTVDASPPAQRVGRLILLLISQDS